jgi:hypothetical protein
MHTHFVLGHYLKQNRWDNNRRRNGRRESQQDKFGRRESK